MTLIVLAYIRIVLFVSFVQSIEYYRCEQSEAISLGIYLVITLV
jgi:hypothetical protein